MADGTGQERFDPDAKVEVEEISEVVKEQPYEATHKPFHELALDHIGHYVQLNEDEFLAGIVEVEELLSCLSIFKNVFIPQDSRDKFIRAFLPLAIRYTEVASNQFGNKKVFHSGLVRICLSQASSIDSLKKHLEELGWVFTPCGCGEEFYIHPSEVKVISGSREEIFKSVLEISSAQEAKPPNDNQI